MSGWKLLTVEKICGSALEAAAGAQHRAGGFTVDEDQMRRGKEYNQPLEIIGQTNSCAQYLLKSILVMVASRP